MEALKGYKRKGRTQKADGVKADVLNLSRYASGLFYSRQDIENLARKNSTDVYELELLSAKFAASNNLSCAAVFWNSFAESCRFVIILSSIQFS